MTGDLQKAEPRDRRASVQSVDRAFMLLRELGTVTSPRSVLELSKATGIDRTVAHRLLRTLSNHEMVLEDGGAYRLGPEAVMLANAYVEALQVRRLAVPYMVDLQAHDLRDEAWTISLSIPVGAISTVVERIWTPRTPLDIVLTSGDNLPLESTATGRSILAYYAEQRVVDVLGNERAEALQEVFEKIRDAGGIAISRGEAIVGLDAVAAVIRSPSGEPVAAIAVVGVDLRDQLGYDTQLANRLRRTAHAIGLMISG